MFKIKVTPATVVALVMGAALAQPAFAGSGPGPVGDGLGVTRLDGSSLLSIISPLRDTTYDYQLFGADGDTVVVGDWDGDGTDSLGVARVDNGALLWILDFTGNGSLVYELFGSDGDIPVVGDWDPNSPGDEIGFARPDAQAGTLEWILKDNTPGDGFSRELFGVDTDIPVPGNWDGDANNGDEPGLARDDNGALLWITQGSGGLDYTLFGAAGNPPVPGDWNGDGNSQPGVRPATGDGNVYILDGASLEYYQIGAPSDASLNSGNFGQP